MKKVLALSIALIMVCSMVIGCGAKAEEAAAPAAAEAKAEEFDPSKIAIGTCSWPTSNPTVAIMAAGFMDRAIELGYEALLLGGDTSDMAVAYQDIDSVIAQHDNFKCLEMNASDEIGWKKVKEITDQGVHVVCCWNIITDETLEKYGIAREMMLGWYAPNAYDYGQAAAKDMAEKVGHKGVIAVTESSFNETEDNAAKGFMDYIKDNEPEMSCLDPQVEGLEAVAAISKVASIIQANPDLVGGYGTTGTSAQSWAGAAEQTGWKGAIIGMDFNAQNLDLLKAGKIYAIVAQPIYDAFKECANVCDAFLRGEDVQSKWTDTSGYMESPIIHQEDADKYIEMISNISVYKSVSEQ